MPTPIDQEARQIPLATTRLSGRRRHNTRFRRGKFSDQAESMTAEQWEFARALQRYKEQSGNYFPNAAEVLEEVVKKMCGYRRVAAAA